jgi:hypothetical protein
MIFAPVVWFDRSKKEKRPGDKLNYRQQGAYPEPSSDAYLRWLMLCYLIFDPFSEAALERA